MAVKFQGGKAVPTSGGDARDLSNLLHRHFRTIKQMQIDLFKIHNELRRVKDDMPTGANLIAQTERADNEVEKLAMAISSAQMSAASHV